MLQLGRKVANDADFYQHFVRYVLAFMTEPSQFVHFRSELVHAVQRHVRHSLVAVTWCALSLASDKYFSEKSTAYGWEPEEEDDIAGRWFEFISSAFLPAQTTRKVDITVLRKWISDFKSLQTRDVGPYTGCELCTSKCFYSYDVPKMITEDIRTTFDALLAISDIATAVGYMRLQTGRMIASYEMDLAFCSTLHIVSRKPLSDEGQEEFMLAARQECERQYAAVAQPTSQERDDWLDIICKTAMARSHWREIYAEQMEKYNITPDEVEERLQKETRDTTSPVRQQVFEIIVRQAMAGTPWRIICAAAMEFNGITADEVEAEVNRRRKE
jgi:hypothetical protein